MSKLKKILISINLIVSMVLTLNPMYTLAATISTEVISNEIMQESNLLKSENQEFDRGRTKKLEVTSEEIIESGNIVSEKEIEEMRANTVDLDSPKKIINNIPLFAIGQTADGKEILSSFSNEELEKKGVSTFEHAYSDGKLSLSLPSGKTVVTFIIYISGVGYVYCLNPSKPAPPNGTPSTGGAGYDGPNPIEIVEEGQKRKAILVYGFPHNNNGNDTIYNEGLDEMGKYIRTYLALNAIVNQDGRFSEADARSLGSTYVNTLLDKGHAKDVPVSDFHIGDTINDLNLKYNVERNIWESDLITTSGGSSDGTTGSFYIAPEQLPNNISIVQENYSDAVGINIPIGSKLRIIAYDSSFQNYDLNIRFETSLINYSANVHYPIVTTLQRLAYLVVTPLNKTISFKIVSSEILGEVDFSKTDVSTGELIEGATIKIEGIDEFNKDIQLEFESSKEGNRFKLPIGNYRFSETIAPEGYELSTEVGYFEIAEGKITKAQLTNKKIIGTVTDGKLPVTGNDTPLILSLIGILTAVIGVSNFKKEKAR